MQLHGQKAAFEKGGARLVLLGNGKPHHARWFLEDSGVDAPVYCDPDLAAYAAAGLKRSVLSVFNPAALGAGIRAWKSGNRQTKTKGDPWQQGGVLVLDRRAGAKKPVLYQHISGFAGDRAPVGKVLAALGVIA